MVDFNKRVKNVDKFRPAAIFFEKNGCYTLAPRGTTDYIQYWEQETNRCLHGYVAEDGDEITGYHYFYLNYSPIMKLDEVEYTDKHGNKRTRRERILGFPRFYDYDYYYFNAIEDAENAGKHMAVLKARQRGYSFKGASMLVRNYELIPGSKNFAVASEQKFLIGDGLLTKAWQIMDFCDKHTAWAKQRLTSTRMERVSGFKITDEFGKSTEQGYLSSITGITLKNDPERIRGTRGKLVLWEEGGKFPNLLTAWRVEQPAVETDDGVAFGLMIAFGCVCAGTKVWTSTGDCVKIEDLQKEQGIIGWDTYQAVQQKIENMNPPAKKPCVRITTNTGRTLECSKDHPILWSKPGWTKRVPGKRAENEYMKQWKFHAAELCKVGEQVAIIDSIPFFGTKKMWEPRVIGWLIGDGSYGFDKTPRLANCDNEINDYIESHFDTAKDRKDRITKDGKVYKETRIKGICPRLRELGIYGQTKSNKRLPEHIHQYDAESLSELIGGIFDTDGYIGIDKSGRPRITLTQCQRELLDQVAEVLIHFGVHCSIKFIKTKNRVRESNGLIIKDGEGYWRLTINDITSIGNFAKYISCDVSYKQSALDLMMLYTQEHLAKYHKYVLGIHAEKIVKIEDIGEQPIYNLTAACNNNYIANGIVTHNTGGTEGGQFDGLKDLFYKPDAYNVLGFPNIWDDNASDTNCGFFVPSWSNMDSVDENGKFRFMDEDGNTFKEKAIEELIRQRNIIKDGGATQASIDRFVSERPIKPQEAVLELGKNIFPRKLLMDQLTKLRTNKKLQSMKHVVDLSWDNGKVVATEKKSGDITTYHLKKDDKPNGSVVIWEYPVNDPPFGLYIGGCDPYDHDESFTNSLGSTFIFKRVRAGEAWNDVIVAEYSGRPATAEEYYENVRKLLTFYNARLLFENERKGIYPYFTNKHCDYMLADQPDKIITEVFKDSKVQRRKGCHMTKQIRAYGEGLILEWLMEEYEEGHPNIERIYSEPLIEELIENDGVKNVDRLIALCMVMIYREELYQVKVAKSKEQNKQVELFDMPLFGSTWWNDNEDAQSGIPTFTF